MLNDITMHQQKTFRGQVAAEFMLYSGVFMFIVIAAYAALGYLQNAELPSRQNSVARETGQSFANVFSFSVSGGRGFSYRYSFPRTVLGIPYRLDFNSWRNGIFVLEWPGTYGNFTYAYSLPNYRYSFAGTCISDLVLDSADERCQNIITLNNGGEILTIVQEEASR